VAALRQGELLVSYKDPLGRRCEKHGRDFTNMGHYSCCVECAGWAKPEPPVTQIELEEEEKRSGESVIAQRNDDTPATVT
jgi:hypothetical protein